MKVFLPAARLLIGLFVVASASRAVAAEHDRQFVSVEGAVNRPGRVELAAGRSSTIVDAISLAGGPTRNGDLKRVWLIRANVKGEPVKTVIDVDALLKGRARDIPSVRGGDRVVVIGRYTDDDGF